jgi:hypothetical protein
MSPNLLSEDDPEKVTWQTFPDTDHGIQAVGGTNHVGVGCVVVSVIGRWLCYWHCAWKLRLVESPVLLIMFLPDRNIDIGDSL